MADYSKTQRIVLLIDLHPLRTFHNPNSYLTSLSATAKRLMAFASLTESLFSFKFFFSSLCPYLSTSAVDQLIGSPFPTSFNLPSETLKSLTTILASMSIPAELVVNHSRASYVASSLYQLVLDYTWESENDDLTGKANVLFPKVSSNLVLLFSHLPKSISSLSEYMDLCWNSGNLKDLDGFAVKFRELFGIVSNAFANKDIHLSWIDVRDGLVGCADNLKVDFEGSMLLEDGIKSYGWGVCSTDSIVLDSALVPFGLIYPKIGISLQFLKCADSSKGRFGQLYLQILDAKGKPLECRCCDLEFMNLSEPQSDERSGESIWCSFGEAGVIKMEIQAIQRYDEGRKVEDFTSSSILVREFFGVSKKCKSKFADDFLAHRVLDMLSGEMGENTKRNSVPVWNILMSFLYEEGCQALVSLSSSNGQIASVLKPLTTHLALLSVIDTKKEHGWNQSQSTGVRDGICNTSVVDTDYLNGSLPEASTSNNCEPPRDERRRKHKKSLDQNLCWNSFCDAAYKCSDINMVDVYYARKPEKSKMLKFFKCWMKQIKKRSGSSSCFLQTSLHPPRSQQQHLPSPLFSQENLMQEGDASFSFPETAEVFFCNLPQWIEHRLRSGADLQSFAERLVKLSVHMLSRKCETDNAAAGHISKQSADISHTNITTELMKLLLQKPRDMKDKLEFNSPTSEVSDFSSISKFIAREYELQVFLRMEILRSDVSESIRRSAKQKLVKQICSLLEIIQYLVEGGIHGHVCLYEYVERTIRIRYSHILKDIVTKIYSEMDLLPFGEEDEIQAHLFNSEDSDQSWKDKLDGSKMAESYSILQHHSSQPADGDESSEAFREDEHARRLIEARERRDIARRSVCARTLDQQRVWAPRQLKVPKGKFEQQKDTQRKDTRKARYSVVCETPMSQTKHIYSPGGEKGHIDSRNSLSVASKALFQDP